MIVKLICSSASLLFIAGTVQAQTISTNVGLHLKMECEGARKQKCKTFQCKGRFEAIDEEPGIREVGEFDACNEQTHVAMAKCKASDVETRTYRVDLRDTPFSVCRKFEEKYTPIANAMLEVEKVYAPIFAKSGMPFRVQNWQSSSVAYVTFEAETAVIRFSQRAFAHKWGKAPLQKEVAEITGCHEVGHFLGGEPTMMDLNGKRFSAEGQADFFATSSDCLTRLWAHDENERFVRENPAPPGVGELCTAQFSDRQDHNHCLRSIATAVAYIGAIDPNVGPLTPSSKEVKETISTIGQYPEPQCRLDTLVQGALHPLSTNEIGSPLPDPRPRCWYQPEQ
jgi:hypothetical protein